MTLSADDLAAAGLSGLLQSVEEAVVSPGRSDPAGDGAEPAGGDPESGDPGGVEASRDRERASAHRGSNVAVVSEPYAGRSVVLDRAVRRAGGATERVSLDGVVEDLPSLPDSEVVVVDDCQYLYTREVGGFDVLDRFLSRIAVSESQFVTGWNRYAWEYLAAVRDVDDLFPTVLEVPALDAEQTADLLSSYASSTPTFVETGAAGRVKTVDVEWTDRVGSRRLPAPVPVPDLNAEYLTSLGLRRSEDVTDVEGVVFQKIAALSNGNPGVATRVWERSLRDGEIAPAYVDDPDRDLTLAEEEAFVLEVLLAKGRLSLSTLASVLDQLPVQRRVQALVERDLVLVEGSTVEVDPESLHAVADYLQGRRLVW